MNFLTEKRTCTVHMWTFEQKIVRRFQNPTCWCTFQRIKMVISIISMRRKFELFNNTNIEPFELFAGVPCVMEHASTTQAVGFFLINDFLRTCSAFPYTPLHAWCYHLSTPFGVFIKWLWTPQVCKNRFSSTQATIRASEIHHKAIFARDVSTIFESMLDV